LLQVFIEVIRYFVLVVVVGNLLEFGNLVDLEGSVLALKLILLL
jgi:hypothetical protein